MSDNKEIIALWDRHKCPSLLSHSFAHLLSRTLEVGLELHLQAVECEPLLL